MIGYRAVLTPGSERYVHHMMLYECHDDRGSSYSRFNHHVNSGYECHAPNMPVDFKVTPTKRSKKTFFDLKRGLCMMIH